MGFRISGFGFRVFGFRVQGLGFRVFGFRVQGLGFRALGIGLGVIVEGLYYSLGFRV